MPLTIVFLFCVKVCRECVKIYYTLRKTEISRDKKPRTTSLATRHSTTELCPQFLKREPKNLYYQRKYTPTLSPTLSHTESNKARFFCAECGRN